MWDRTLCETSTTSHLIGLKLGSHPIAQHPSRARPRANEAEDLEVRRMLEAGVIEPAQSEWVSLVVLVSKPDGFLRLCVDYRKLNAVNANNSYNIPRMEECIYALGDAKWITTLD